jgi:hypothetical protein
LPGINPYQVPAGPELDELIHERIFRESSNALSYSTSMKFADKLRARIKTLYGCRVVVGETQLRAKPYFARFESGPSTSTEVLADSVPLALCRLALLLSERHDH